jgi:hypothetical protein
MARFINIHAGDFEKRPNHYYKNGKFYMRIKGKFFPEKIYSSQIAKLELATEESVISLGGAAGWGIAGTVLLGPIGLLAGLILGGKGKKVTFICVFKDGRKFLGTMKWLRKTGQKNRIC